MFLTVVTALFFILGLSATGQNLGFSAIVEHTSPDIKASALGLNNGIIMLSCAILPLIISHIIFLSSGSSNAQHLSLHSFVLSLSALPAVYLISLVISIFRSVPQQNQLFSEISSNFISIANE